MRKNRFETHTLRKPKGSGDKPGQGQPQDAELPFDTLEHMLDFHQQMGVEHYKKTPDEMFMPMIVCVCADGSVAPVIAVDAFKDEERKAEFFDFMRANMKDWNVVRYVSLVEAWMATAATSDKDAYLNDYTPSQRADRKECFVMVAADKERAIGRLLLIKRDPQSGRATLEEERELAGMATQMGGRFAELLKEAAGNPVWWLDAGEMGLWRAALDIDNHGKPERFKDYEATLAEGKRLLATLEQAYRLQQSKLLGLEGAKMAAKLRPELVAFMQRLLDHWLTLDGESPEDWKRKAKLMTAFGLTPEKVAEALRRKR